LNFCNKPLKHSRKKFKFDQKQLQNAKKMQNVCQVFKKGQNAENGQIFKPFISGHQFKKRPNLADFYPS